MSVDHSDYLNIIRQLPRPTLAQTERFARFVSEAHSWYKHLPIESEVPFVFYLDPGAGKNLVHTDTGEVALIDVTDKTTQFHYSWQKTEDYRRRFGYWNYHASYGTGFMFRGEGGTVSTTDERAQILTSEGTWASVPPELADVGTALLSAMVHSHSSILVFMGGPERYEAAADSLWKVLEGSGGCRDVDSGVQRVLGMIPPPTDEHAVPRLGGSDSRDWDWPDEAWLRELAVAGMDEALVSRVVKHVDVESTKSLWTERLQKWAKLRPEHVGGSEWPPKLVAVILAVAEERGRQLSAITTAMDRFIDAVFP